MSEIGNEPISHLGTIKPAIAPAVPSPDKLKEVSFGDRAEGQEFWFEGKSGVVFHMRKELLRPNDRFERELPNTNTLMLDGPRAGWRGFMTDDTLVLVLK